MHSSSQIVNSVKVSFIKPFTLPNFIENFQSLNPKFNFMTNSTDYSQYYKSLETGKGNIEIGRNQGLLGSEDFYESFGTDFQTKEFKVIPHLGLLKPLTKKHTLNSYWQSIRLTLKIQEKIGRPRNELFLLLPLKIDIPIRSIKSDGIKFPVSLYVYLFPFGSCCVNMDINIRIKYNFDEFSKLVAGLKRSILSDGKSFESFSKAVAHTLNQELFVDGIDVIPFSTHDFIFVENMSEILDAGFNEHKLAIAAAMMGKTVTDVSGMTMEAIDQQIPCRLKKLRDGEILFFNPKSTFIHPSPIWFERLQNEGKHIQMKKFNCMCNNYRSILNEIFAVNRFLRDSFLENKDKLPNNRLLEIIKCFTTAFPEIPLNGSNKIYSRNAFEPIAKQVGLFEALKIIR